MLPVSVIIPAYNEEDRIGKTLKALFIQSLYKEIIVVDDGSQDQTYAEAEKWTDHIIKFPLNLGKSEAIRRGSLYATQPILLFLDADLGETAALASDLVPPVLEGTADMTIAKLPQTKKSGFGLVKRLARAGIYRRTGKRLAAPLSGQRAIKRQVFHSCYKGDYRFGLEVGLTIDCLNRGYTVLELDIPFTHRETGKNISGFFHRFKQGVAVYHALKARRTTWKV